jgi:hypothetical protein
MLVVSETLATFNTKERVDQEWSIYPELSLLSSSFQEFSNSLEVQKQYMRRWCTQLVDKSHIQRYVLVQICTKDIYSINFPNDSSIN